MADGTGSLRVTLTAFGPYVGPRLFYAQTSASTARYGVFVQASSGSPQISMLPRDGTPTLLLAGDLWFQSSGSSGNSNLFVAEQALADSIVYAHRVITSRENENTVEQIISRYTGSDAPSDVFVGANAVVIDNFYVVVNSEAVSGALVRNATWDGGFYMPDESTVAVSGTDIDFLVPSGAVIVERGNFTLLSGSLTVYSGSILLEGETASFVISASHVSATLLGNPIVSLRTGSVASSSLGPPVIDGMMYINTGSIPNAEISIRASGEFYDLDVDAPELIDGGAYT